MRRGNSILPYLAYLVGKSNYRNPVTVEEPLYLLVTSLALLEIPLVSIPWRTSRMTGWGLCSVGLGLSTLLKEGIFEHLWSMEKPYLLYHILDRQRNLLFHIRRSYYILQGIGRSSEWKGQRWHWRPNYTWSWAIGTHVRASVTWKGFSSFWLLRAAPRARAVADPRWGSGGVLIRLQLSGGSRGGGLWGLEPPTPPPIRHLL